MKRLNAALEFFPFALPTGNVRDMDNCYSNKSYELYVLILILDS